MTPLWIPTDTNTHAHTHIATDTDTDIDIQLHVAGNSYLATLLTSVAICLLTPVAGVEV